MKHKIYTIILSCLLLINGAKGDEYSQNLIENDIYKSKKAFKNTFIGKWKLVKINENDSLIWKQIRQSKEWFSKLIADK